MRVRANGYAKSIQTASQFPKFFKFSSAGFQVSFPIVGRDFMFSVTASNLSEVQNEKVKVVV